MQRYFCHVSILSTHNIYVSRIHYNRFKKNNDVFINNYVYVFVSVNLLFFLTYDRYLLFCVFRLFLSLHGVWVVLHARISIVKKSVSHEITMFWVVGRTYLGGWLCAREQKCRERSSSSKKTLIVNGSRRRDCDDLRTLYTHTTSNDFWMLCAHIGKQRIRSRTMSSQFGGEYSEWWKRD